jgi:hypothetical protein
MNKTSMIPAILIAGFAAGVFAQTDSHTMSVTVSAINVIDVDNNVSLTINSATAGQQPTAVSDNTTANLSWTTNGSGKKIQVKTGAALPSGLTLTVLAQNITKVGSGTPAAAGTVTLSDTDQDFVTSAGKSAGTCDLNYTASATVDADIQANTITVTYTVTNG